MMLGKAAPKLLMQRQLPRTMGVPQQSCVSEWPTTPHVVWDGTVGIQVPAPHFAGKAAEAQEKIVLVLLISLLFQPYA